MRPSRRHLSPARAASRSPWRQHQVRPLLTMRPTFHAREMSGGPSPSISESGADSLTWWESSARGNLLSLKLTINADGRSGVANGSGRPRLKRPHDLFLAPDAAGVDHLEQGARQD